MSGNNPTSYNSWTGSTSTIGCGSYSLLSSHQTRPAQYSFSSISELPDTAGCVTGEMFMSSVSPRISCSFAIAIMFRCNSRKVDKLNRLTISSPVTTDVTCRRTKGAWERRSQTTHGDAYEMARTFRLRNSGMRAQSSARNVATPPPNECPTMTN